MIDVFLKNKKSAELRFLTLKRENYKGIALSQALGTILHVSKVLILILVVNGVLFCTVKNMWFMSNSAVLLWLWFRFLMFKVDAVFRRAFY